MYSIRNIKGLTITELMIVLAIVMITAGISIPMYISDIPRQRVKAAAQQMMTDLRLARARAVANNQAYLVCFGSDTTYKMAPEINDDATDCDTAETIAIWKVQVKAVDYVKTHSGVQFGIGNSGSNPCMGQTTSPSSAVEFSSKIARFDKRGSSVDGSGALYSGAVYLTNPRDSKNRTYCVQVEASTGRAKLYKWDQGAWQ